LKAQEHKSPPAAQGYPAKPNSAQAKTGDVKPELWIVKLTGPVTRASFNALEATGAKAVGYVPNNAYLVRGAPEEMARAFGLRQSESSALTSGGSGSPTVRWIGRLDADLKIDPVFSDELISAYPQSIVDIEVEMLETPEAEHNLPVL